MLNNYNYSMNGTPLPGQMSTSLLQPNFLMPYGSCTPRQFITRIVPLSTPRCWIPNGSFWSLREQNGQIKQIADILITHFAVVNPHRDNTFDAAVIGYISNGRADFTVIPYKAYTSRKLLRYFKNISKHPDASDKMLEDLLYYLIQQAETSNFLIIPTHPGWNMLSPLVQFITRNDVNPYLESYYPDSVKERSLPTMSTPLGDIVNQIEKLFSAHTETKILLGLVTGSLLGTLFSSENIELEQAVILNPSEHMNEHMLTAILKTQNYDSLVTQSLSATKKEIQKTLDKSNDGIALFSDKSEITEEKDNKTGINRILEDLQHSHNEEDYSKHIICIISRFADRYFPWEQALRLSFDNIKLTCTPNQMQKLMGQFSSCLIQQTAANFNSVMDTIHDVAIHQEEAFQNVTPQKRSTCAMLLCVHSILGKLFNYSLFINDDFNSIYAWLNSRKEYLDISQTIVDDFSFVLNNCIRNNEINLVQKTEYTVFEKVTNTMIAMNDVLCTEPETIEQLLLPRCVNQNLNTLITSLKECGFLYATNRNRHPVHVYNSSGASVTIHSYSISQKILDADNQKKIDNLSNEEFFFTLNEQPVREFLPLIQNYDGRNAGRLIRFRDEENNHIYITGQSGYGKTFLLSQLIAAFISLNHKVVIFDSSDSFTYEAMCHNLSQNFVDYFVAFYSLEDDGIPVDLFNLDEYPKTASKKKILAGILTAATDSLSAIQSNKLKAALQEMLLNLPSMTRISTQRILERFDEEDTTYASLISRFTSVFEDIEDCGMSEKTWSEFLSIRQKVIVIKTETSFTESGNQLFDMMLATLYNYQVKHQDSQLDIIIDEVQNQNTAKGSPIYKILKEGRKLHMAFIGATQAYHTRGDRIGDTMNIADTKIFLKPTPDAERAVASALDYNDSKRSAFHKMERGQCLISSNFYSKEKKQNCPAVISGDVVKTPLDTLTDIIRNNLPENYYGNAY